MIPTAPQPSAVPAAHRRHERGSASLELAIIAPGLLMILMMLIVAGRLALARDAVTDAADSAARAASISRTAAGAEQAANEVGAAALDGKGVRCTTRTITVDTSGFDAPLGVTTQVDTTITCTVNLSDVALPGLPGSKTITGTGRSVIDAYRERR